MQARESTLEALPNRLAQIESRNRRLTKVGVALLVAACAAIAMGQAPAKKAIEAADTERLREIATSTIETSSDDAKIKNAAELLKLASEIDRYRDDAHKAKLEEDKMSQDLGESQR